MTSSLFEAQKELQTATDELLLAQRQLSDARSAECAAVNRVNAAQRKLDTEIAELKKSAPQGTDWKRPRGLPES